jgi:eukaryotic translation initiation factor 2C
LSSSYKCAGRYGSGPLPNVALSVLRSRNARDLDVHEDHVYFRKLKNFLKNLLVMVTPTGGPPNARSRKKKIRGLVANAGNFEFDKDGRVTTVKVWAIPDYSP